MDFDNFLQHPLKSKYNLVQNLPKVTSHIYKDASFFLFFCCLFSFLGHQSCFFSVYWSFLPNSFLSCFLNYICQSQGKMRTCTRKAMSTTSVVMTPQTSPRTPLATVEEPMSTSIYKSDDHCQTIMTSVSQIMLSLTRVNIDVTWNMCWNGRWGNALKLARWE